MWEGRHRSTTDGDGIVGGGTGVVSHRSTGHYRQDMGLSRGSWGEEKGVVSGGRTGTTEG